MTDNIGKFGKAAMGVITRLESQNRTLVEALRKVAIVHHVRMAYGGGTVPSGYSCEVCDANCEQGDSLIHADDCPLSVLNPT